ncbi:cation transporter [Actinopolyspora erythraea]|uniref:Cation transporter n=1 Tax=Actinopolyspora erythraea TaxID=414996 RepID=A0A099D1V6_9ACTN|nr:cation diffusion facilitator family transporter [Actinopolyspora erythraea]ASU77786.1 cation transporter [Actinopolyspora erythraea]KGI79999.1 cation transporter [Actinopolyspora erythraea]
MGHGHGHGGTGEAAASASGRYVRRLALSLLILLAFFVVEVVVGFLTSSLALLSDAGHMLTDVLGIGMALAAITAARRTSGSRSTFGLYRVEVLAALANAVLLFGVAGYILYEAIGRLARPPEVPGVPMMLTAAAGLAANLVVFALLRRGADESLNVRGAYLEVLADTVGSVGVLLGGVLTWAFGWGLADPIVAVAVGLFVLPRTYKLARQALRILVQQAPEGVDVERMHGDLAEIEPVTEVHDLHVWTLTSGMEVASAHLTTTSEADHCEVLASAQRLLSERYHIEHATLQIEPRDRATGCHSLKW